MDQFEISAELRETQGKGASRRLRRAGKVPGIIYGGSGEPQLIQVDHNELSYRLRQEAFYSHILTINLNGSAQRVVLKDLQRHSYKQEIRHLDLLRIDEAAELTMRVPLHYMNEEKCLGVRQSGGVIQHVLTELEVTCLPKNLPEYIEVDVEALDIGDTVQVGNLTMPEGVRVLSLLHGGDPTQTLVSVQIPKVVVEETEVSDEEAEAALAAEAVEAGEEAADGAAKPEGASEESAKEGDEAKKS